MHRFHGRDPGGGRCTVPDPYHLIDMNGASGRVDGGVGVTLDESGCVLDARKAPG